MSELFLGAMTFGEQGGAGASPQECRRILDAYADAGGNVIDTAINHRGGASEEILGELLDGRRDRFVRAGRILYVGISDTPAWLISRANTLAQWHAWTPFAGPGTRSTSCCMGK